MVKKRYTIVYEQNGIEREKSFTIRESAIRFQSMIEKLKGVDIIRFRVDYPSTEKFILAKKRRIGRKLRM